MIHALTQRHLLPMSTPATGLRRVRRVDLDHPSASFFRFAGQVREKGRPCCVTDTFRQAMMVHHPIDMQIFYTDHPKAVYKLSGLLLGEVVAFEPRAFVHPCHHLAMLATLGRSRRQFGVFALDSCQRFLFTAKETRVDNLFSCRQGSERLESHINAYGCAERVETLGVAFTRKGDVPLAGAAFVNGRCFDCATHRTVVDHLDGTDFRERDTSAVRDGEATLWEGEALVASGAFETGEAWFLTRFAASKERFHAEVNTHRNVLQDLRMNQSEGRALFFQERIGGLLPIITQALALLHVRCFALFEQVVVEPAALFECRLQRGELFLGRINPILKGLHHRSIVAHFVSSVKQCLKFPYGVCPVPSTPRKEGRCIRVFGKQGPSGPFGKNRPYCASYL